MSIRYRVALHGFSRFERDALFYCFKHDDPGAWGYEVVDSLEASDFIVADASHEIVNRDIACADRMCDTLFVGHKMPEGASAFVERPIDPKRIVRALDDMILCLCEALRESNEASLPSAEVAARPDIVLPIEEGEGVGAPWAGEDFSADTDTAPMAFRPELLDEPKPVITRSTTDVPEPPVSVRERVVSQSANEADPPVKSALNLEAERAAAKAAARRAVRRAQLAHAPKAAPLIADVLVLVNEPDHGYLCGQLEAFGFRVHRVMTSEEAMIVLREQSLVAAFFDLVLSDFDDIDGLDMCLGIKQKKLALAGDEIPAVMLVSGKATATARVQAKLIGCDAFLVQPLMRGDVVRALEASGIALPADPRQG